MVKLTCSPPVVTFHHKSGTTPTKMSQAYKPPQNGSFIQIVEIVEEKASYAIARFCKCNESTVIYT